MNKVKLGFIGAGWWATSNHMPLLAAREDVEMTAVCRLGAAELQLVKEKFGFRHAREDFIEMLDACELDAVVVSSPHKLHYEHSKASLERGLHVLCEKPFTTRADQARELVELAKDKGVHLVVAYGWHYMPFIQQAKQWMDQGLVGRIESVMCHMASPTRALLSGQVIKGDDIEGSKDENLFDPEPGTWADPDKAGGGYGHAQISHSAGMMFWLTGLRPRSVYALMTAPGAQVDLHDAMAVRYDGGAIGTVYGAGTLPSDRPYQVDIRVFGSEGVLLLDCERARAELRRDDGEHRTMEVATDAGAYQCDGPPHNLVDLVTGAAEINYGPAEPALSCVELLEAAYRSAAEGREVEIREG